MDENEYEKYVNGFVSGIRNAGLPQKYQQPVFREFTVTMQDDIKLKTYAFLPAENGSWPTIVQRGPYAMQDPMNKIIGQEVAKLGFAYVFQFCRGIGGSEGVWQPQINERKDGLDFVNWLDDQDWISSMGFYGSSYLAMTGWAIADKVPSKMKTMYLSNYGLHGDISNYQAGLTKPDILTGWAMDNAGFEISADFEESARYLPQYTVDVDLWGGKLDWYRDALSSPKETDHYWSTDFFKELRGIPGNIHIPLFISDAWYDHHFENAMTTFKQLPKETKEKSVLQIGGWNHFMQNAIQGRTTTHLLRNETGRMLQWFNSILVKNEQPVGKLMTYEIGSDTWNETGWSETSEHEQIKWFLNFDDKENKLGLMKSESNLNSGSYTYDPQNPVPSLGGEALLHTMDKAGSQEQLPIGTRDDVISFVSDPLKQDIHLDGSIEVKLNVASSAEDTEFVIKVSSILPDGKTYNIRTQATTIVANTDNYQPNTTTEVKLKTWPISYFLPQVSKLRLDVTSSDFPQYEIHTNYPGNQALQAKSKIAKQTIISNSKNPSSILVTIK